MKRRARAAAPGPQRGRRHPQLSPQLLPENGAQLLVAQVEVAAQLPAGTARRCKPLQERKRRLDGRARLVALLAREGRHRIARRRVEGEDLPRRRSGHGAGPGPRGRRQRLARDGAARRRVDEGFDGPYSGWLSTSRLVVARGPAPTIFQEGSHRCCPLGRGRAGRLPRHDDFAATLGPRALRSPKRACASSTESWRPAEALLCSAGRAYGRVEGTSLATSAGQGL